MDPAFPTILLNGAQPAHFPNEISNAREARHYMNNCLEKPMPIHWQCAARAFEVLCRGGFIDHARDVILQALARDGYAVRHQ